MTQAAMSSALLAVIDAVAGADGDDDRVRAALERLDLEPGAAAAVLDRLLGARRELGRLRRREHELTALFASARELAEVHDTGTLLDRLVDRAHTMMGCDVTYLSEFDSRSRTLRVRTTKGSVSPLFQQLEVPPGAGLAGAVVESRAAHWVADYTRYAAERHDAGVDDAVAAEGLVSILGVPMLSGADVLGVLFVANRQEMAFTQEAIALLSALADHASVVLQTAQRIRELQRSDDEARSALERLTAHLGERDRANTVHQDLLRAVLAGGGFGPVARTLGAALGRRVVVIDERDRPIADSEPSGELTLGAVTRGALDAARTSGRCVLVDDDGLSAVASMTAGARYFGAALLGVGTFELTPVDRRTVERAMQVGALLALQREAVAEAESRIRAELVADLVDGDPERRADGERRARRLGVGVAGLDTVLLFTVTGAGRGALVRAAQQQLPGALVGERRGAVVALVPSDTDAEGVRARLAGAVGEPVGCVRPPGVDSVAGLAAAVATATRTARLLSALGIAGTTEHTDDYLPYSAVLDTDPRSLREFLDATIGAVRAYDAERGTELLTTLRAFVRHNASPTRTARALNFHPNTILQRLDRLDRVLGTTWRNEERLFRISLAVRLDELAARVDPHINSGDQWAEHP
ncbi:helix-turn-helix domain-containing protein [Cryptosporangium arvum]|uniref:helix-turn-helix domain-containing protein n=1 Tax=Cryptosporangium arvum TaxID=80871 RepID=UPI0004AD1AB2|nr:helix-turn-helix domain-containing protein [Cryptosporangium arvum]